MPGGWKMSQIEAEQPATTYAEFKREILNEIARCLNMPYNVAAGNSRATTTPPAGSIIRPTSSPSASSRRIWRASCSIAFSPPGSTRPC